MDNNYQDKLNEYIKSIKDLMYTFEITKCCGYSTFITIYKDETTADLYKKVAYHFGGAEVVDLYYITSNLERIRVPLSITPIFKFVRDNIVCKPVQLVPIYPIPNPIVYRLYFNDGYHCNHNNNSDSDHCLNIGNNCNTNNI